MEQLDMCIVCEARKSFKKNYRVIFEGGNAPLAGAPLGPVVDVPQDGNTATAINSPTGDQNIDALLAARRYLSTQLTF